MWVSHTLPHFLERKAFSLSLPLAYFMKTETKADIQKKLRKTLAEIYALLDSPWLTPETRKHLEEKRNKLSQEAFK